MKNSNEGQFQDYLPLHKMFQNIYHKANLKLKTKETILPELKTKVKTIDVAWFDNTQTCRVKVSEEESHLIWIAFTFNNSSSCLTPHVLHPGLVSTSSDITDTPVYWDTGPCHSIRLFRKDKVLVLMKSLLENLRVQKSMWIQRAPEHWSRLPPALTTHALFGYERE